MLKIAYSGLLNAQIARTVIWKSSWKLYFSQAWLRSRRARHGALRIAGASFGTLTSRRRGRLIGGAGTILPDCWRRSTFSDAPPSGLVRTKPRCTLQAHDVAIEEAQHFGKIFVKSARLSTRHHQRSCSWRQMLWQLAAWKASYRRQWIPRAWMYAIVWSETKLVGVFAAGMEGKRFAMTVLTVLLSVCSHCEHQLGLLRQNLMRKLKQDLQNIWLPLQSCRRDITLLKHSAYSLVWRRWQRLLLTKQISLCWTKVHQTSSHQITFGAIGPKLLYHSSCAFSKSAEDVHIVGVDCQSVTKF